MDICWWVGVGREGKGNTKLTPRYLPSTSRGGTDAISGDGAWKNPHPELLSPAVPFDTKRMCQVDSWLGGGSQLGHKIWEYLQGFAQLFWGGFSAPRQELFKT